MWTMVYRIGGGKDKVQCEITLNTDKTECLIFRNNFFFFKQKTAYEIRLSLVGSGRKSEPTLRHVKEFATSHLKHLT